MSGLSSKSEAGSTEVPGGMEVPGGVASSRVRERRERSRRNLLRANSAVGLIILTILLLAIAAIWQGARATRHQEAAQQLQARAEGAESEARVELWRALVAEARASRRTQRLGQREAILNNLRRAAAIRASPELRNEAVAALALPESTLEQVIPLEEAVRVYEFDSRFQFCALGRTDGDVVVRRIADGSEWRRLRRGDGPVPEEQGWVELVEFSPDGNRLAVRYQRGALGLWDLTTGRLLFLRDADQTRRPASRPEFSSDGRFLVGPVFTPDGFEVMDSFTGATIAHFPEINSYHHCSVRPGHREFAVFNGREILHIHWGTRQVLGRFPMERGARGLSWSRDGRKLCAVGNSLEVSVWDLSLGKRWTLRGHQDSVVRGVFDPTGERLATVSLDGTTRLWDIAEERELGVTTDRRLLRWGADGRTGWSIPREQLEVRREGPSDVYSLLSGVPEGGLPHSLDLSPDGEWALSVAESGGLLAWRLAEPGRPVRWAHTNVHSVCFHPATGKLLVVHDRQLETWPLRVVTNGFEHRGPEVVLRNDPVESAVPVPGGGHWIGMDRSGQTLASINLDSAGIWAQSLVGESSPVRMDIANYNLLAEHAVAVGGSGTIALNPDGRWLVCGADGRAGTCVYDTRTGQLLRMLDSDTGGVQFSPDGRWLVKAGPRECQLYRTDDWSLAWSARGNSRTPSYSGAAAFSPDGSMLGWVSSSRQVSLVECASGRDLALLEAPVPVPVKALRWTRDGRRLVAATRENSLDVWNLEPLRRDLAQLGLTWDPPPRTVSDDRTREPNMRRELWSASTRWLAPLLLAVSAVVATLALVSLRQHRELIKEFARAEAQASQWERELRLEKEVGELKNGFVSMVSHEFRTPLGIIQSSAQILDRYLDRLSAADRREQLTSITGNVRRMAGLIEEVLLLGKSDAGQLQFQRAPLDLGGLISRVASEVQTATGGVCPIVVTGECPTGAVADEQLLRHILTNLLSNAVKYSPAGKLVQLSVERQGDHAAMTVTDHGFGIPVGDRSRLFTAFQRGSNVGAVRGTGLGLSIVKRCVELHGGRISFQSEENLGTVFTVAVPAYGELAGKPPQRDAEPGADPSPQIS